MCAKYIHIWQTVPKTENPPLLFCMLVSCFLSSDSTRPSPVMHVFIVCIRCMCVFDKMSVSNFYW